MPTAKGKLCGRCQARVTRAYDGLCDGCRGADRTLRIGGAIEWHTAFDRLYWQCPPEFRLELCNEAMLLIKAYQDEAMKRLEKVYEETKTGAKCIPLINN